MYEMLIFFVKIVCNKLGDKTSIGTNYSSQLTAGEFCEVTIPATALGSVGEKISGCDIYYMGTNLYIDSIIIATA